MTQPGRQTGYRGDAEARALSSALSASGGWTPCEGQEPLRIDPVLCTSCPVRTECGDYGRAVRGSGTFGGARLIQGRAPRGRDHGASQGDVARASHDE